MIYPYFVLGVSGSLVYYLLFKYKYDKEWKLSALVAAFGGMIASIGSILEGYFPSSARLIKNVFAVPSIISVVIFFYLIIPQMWRMRKDATRQPMIYIAFGILALLVILVIVALVLAKLGFYG